ncbi:MAG: DUF4936 family protein [Burkholderiaceae bacterium]|nr:DUF4936 family protein [Burkholderiaceae bacterium]
MDLFIYYRVKEADAAALAPQIAAMQAQLSAAHGVRSALKRRPGSKDGLQTWMEVYEATPPGFDDRLSAALDGAAFAQLISGPRHTEIFVDVAPCA